MGNIKVSVIMPIFNADNHLEKCLNSITNQTLEDIEIICVNNNSEDDSLDILERHTKKDKRIIIINNKENKADIFSKSSDLNIPSGEYIFFIDSNEEIHQKMLETLYNKIKFKNKTVHMINSADNYLMFILDSLMEYPKNLLIENPFIAKDDLLKIKNSNEKLILKNRNLKKRISELELRIKILQSIKGYVKYKSKNLLNRGKGFLKKIIQSLSRKIDILNGKFHKKALIIEINDYHGVVIPGIAKYFLDLGYSVDVIMNSDLFDTYPFGLYKSRKIKIKRHSIKEISSIIKNETHFGKYKKIFFSSMETWRVKPQYLLLSDIFPNIKSKRNKNKIFFLRHQRMDEKNDLESRTVYLWNLVSNNIVNTHYFGDVKITKKNPEITYFIAVGYFDQQNKNCEIMIDAVEKLHDKGIENFKIILVGRGGEELILPKHIKKYFKVCGFLKYPEMYHELEKADFLLTLLDPYDSKYEKYLTNQVSGSLLLILGFKKPCLINDKFAKIYRFNKENSLIYSGNELLKSMQDAIEMNQKEYLKIQENLIKFSDKIEKESLKNLENLIN